MSKIGKIPITVGNGVTVTVQGENVQVSGPKGNVSYKLPKGISVAVGDGKVSVMAENKEDRMVRAQYGLTRANLANIVKGVDNGFQKILELTGVGYRAQMQGESLVLSL